MGFLFFGKKRVSEVKEAMRQMDTISHNLKGSFVRIKSDMKVIRDWLSFFKTKDKEYEDRFKNMEARIEEIGEVITIIHKNRDNVPIQQPQAPKIPEKEVKEPLYYEYEQETDPKKPQRNPLDDLTETQRAIFFRIGTFQLETGREWTPIKTLAQDLYPEKSYDKVRSTISEYLGILTDAGLAEKMRKGKQTYIKLTSKSQELFNSSKPKGTVPAKAKKGKKK